MEISTFLFRCLPQAGFQFLCVPSPDGELPRQPGFRSGGA